MNKPSPHGHAKNALCWLAFAMLSFWLSVASAWWLSSRIDYGYPLWYQLLSIDEHIARYAPHHPTRKGFAEAGADVHRRVFSDITKAVHGQGTELGSIRYQTTAGQWVTLLGDEEITHLNDVARLLRLAGWATLLMVPIWLWLATARYQAVSPPRRHKALSVAVVAALVVVPLLLAGPTAVFYQLHVWIFPPENPWFFYWEESLMSTLMKAPDLFGAIAVQIMLLALLLIYPVQTIGHRLGRLFLRR
ncbi:MAG: DUF1461 domain-containing protein [Alcanivoracaceae bacterium]